MKRLALLASLAVGVSACAADSSPTEVLRPEMSLHADESVVLNARGSGHFREHPQRVFTFNARRFEDGSADGRYNLNIGGEVQIRGDVTCVSTNGAGRVWVGAVVTGGNTWPVGARIAFTAEDNGKEDRISLAVWSPSLPDYDQLICDVQPNDFGMYDVERGNITVD